MMSESQIELLDGVPETCDQCGKPLCLRKQVINLALGNTDEMRCLKCLAKEFGNTPRDVMATTQDYVQGRDCFKKEWRRYRSVADCPDRRGCIPDSCFAD